LRQVLSKERNIQPQVPNNIVSKTVSNEKKFDLIYSANNNLKHLEDLQARLNALTSNYSSKLTTVNVNPPEGFRTEDRRFVSGLMNNDKVIV